MAVTFDAVGPSSSGAGSSSSSTLSWTHTTVGSPAVLIAGVALGDTNGTDGGKDFSITADGNAMTLISGPIHGNGAAFGFIKVYGITGLSSGAHTIAVTATGATPSALAGGSLSFTGAAGFGTPATATGNSATSSVSVPTSTSGNLIAAVVGTGEGGETATAPATLQYKKDQLSFCIGNCAGETTASTGSAVTVGFTQTSDFWAIIAVEVLASAAALVPLQLASRRRLTRALWRGGAGQAYAFVSAPLQEFRLAPRRKLARAYVQFTPVVTTNAGAAPGVAGSVPVLMANQTRIMVRRDGRVARY